MQRAAWCNKHKLKNDLGSNFYLLHLKKRKREEKRKKEIAVEGVIAFSLQLLFLHIIPIDSRKSVLHYLWARKSSPLQFRTSFAFYSLKRISERYVGLVAEGGGVRGVCYVGPDLAIWATFYAPWQLFFEKRTQNLVRFWAIFVMALRFCQFGNHDWNVGYFLPKQSGHTASDQYIKYNYEEISLHVRLAKFCRSGEQCDKILEWKVAQSCPKVGQK